MIVAEFFFSCIYALFTGILLDGIAGAARVGGRVPADAVGDDPAGGRRAPAHRQHVHLAALHPALLLAARAKA